MNDLPIRWEWDDDKNEENWHKHRISFEVARFLFQDPLVTPNPPKRWAVALTPGMMGKGRRTGQARFQ